MNEWMNEWMKENKYINNVKWKKETNKGVIKHYDTKLICWPF